ncbi:sigma-70 family RNA polymerase sigma factor [Spirosoma sp. KCTC 42546]|uniref:RNA polymerase sigma factor n=1 Tax=Spirosoma sp. KCTC 42546 TaxID=2520506 RepID=UPI001157C07C|nr:sigma-70 family RNA polymerase sigma factor [Spirosoma sp. KCTC 42546]QDK77874.1 sigma-70 family RNA polymerase sigma factor [Spirosoma sp. KCTC 42546]
MLKLNIGQQAQNTWEKTDETLLWQQFREGQQEAFQGLVQHFYRELHFYGGRFTRDSDLLKDCLQDLFLDLWTYRHKIVQTPYIRPYLYKSLRRKIHREVMRHSAVVSEDSVPFDDVSSEEITAEQALIRTELSEYQTARLHALLATLSDRQREAIHLKFYAELSNDEIADILAVNKQSVANLLHRGLSRLRESWPSLLSLFGWLVNESFPK